MPIPTRKPPFPSILTYVNAGLQSALGRRLEGACAIDAVSLSLPSLPGHPSRGVGPRTAVRVLGDVARLGVDDGLDEGRQVRVLRQQLVQVGELVACVAEPLCTGGEANAVLLAGPGRRAKA